MKQNKYDDAEFFANYSQMPRSIDGLNAAGEWQELRAMLPDLRDIKVLDLGCGFGWHCRYVREQDANSVVGVDLSENMLERARAMTNDDNIKYLRLAIEDIDFAVGEFDVVISSLALHYVEDFAMICEKIHHCLAAGGTFVLSIEHPIFTALASQDWYYGSLGERLHWPVDNYQDESSRQARFLDNDVIKYHRTFATTMNALIESGFTIKKVSEPQPTQDMLDMIPDMRDEARRPIFLMIAAERT
ncbi:MAG: class I SAM-dependent methyltransferase [Candidatus Pristimantibacillus sp.]